MAPNTKSEVLKFCTVFSCLGFVSCGSPIVKIDFPKEISTVNLTSGLLTTERTSRFSPIKKWQVGRVSRKQYEIVNMLWRKTKIFQNMDTTAPVENRFRRNYRPTTDRRDENIRPLTYAYPKPVLLPSTASYIEFYYLDDNDERVKRRESFIPKLGNSQPRQISNEILKSPVIAFRIDDYERTSLPQKTYLPEKRKMAENLKPHKQPVNERPSIYGYLSSRFKVALIPMDKQNNVSSYTNPEVYFGNETCPSTTLGTENYTNATQNTIANSTSHEISSSKYEIKTTAYDKIKFFEIYDHHTMRPISEAEKAILNADDFENMVKENYIDIQQKVNLEDVDQNISHHDGSKVKNVKKHIDQNLNPPSLNISEDKMDKKLKFKTVTFNFNKTVAEFLSVSRKILKNSSRLVSWSSYPFAAVYVYEPSQIHCDAAALSPHWLVAAGSCLSRFHNQDPVIEDRSAFVAYCGQNWWQPERVSYVKYSIVHPRFHPKDDTRRLLYNIGLVQVVGSMSSCFGWAPITLMSHHFAADSDGSMGTAIGWGLDRFDVRYSLVELPKQPLSAFDGFVYSETCPGSTIFGKRKFLNEETGLKNMYCLSLPPYSGEQNDPVHGSLLLVGGKLIALYLQEERRAWGDQSAQYTGVWGLVPWVNEIAREQEDDGFAVDF